MVNPPWQKHLGKIDHGKSAKTMAKIVMATRPWQKWPWQNNDLGNLIMAKYSHGNID